MIKILTIVFSLTLVLAVSFRVNAANNKGSEPVQNKNQVQTQNQGEEQQLQVGTQEQQGAETEESSNSNSQNSNPQGKTKSLTETGSFVSQQIKQLLNTESASGGIGDQVREWAKVQNQSQAKIQKHLDVVEERKGLVRSLFGPNYGSLNELKKEMQQNRVRVQQLEQLKLKLTNQADITNVQEMITLMQEENASLQEKITLEESNSGVFGWLIKLLTK